MGGLVSGVHHILIACPLQHGFTNAPQCYVICTLPVLFICLQFISGLPLIAFIDWVAANSAFAGRGRKRSWRNVIYCPEICRETQRTDEKNWTGSIPTGIGTVRVEMCFNSVTILALFSDIFGSNSFTVNFFYKSTNFYVT